MVALNSLLSHCNTLLAVERFRDYCPNGLQVEGRREIQRIISGVSACQALLDRAVIARADLILVHHGYFWKGENACVTGIKRKRLQTLLRHELNLLAYHLPLDAHAALGNNAQLGERLGFQVETPLTEEGIGLLGRPQQASLTGRTLASHLARVLRREPLFIGDPERPVTRVAWCTGAAQGYIEQAIEQGADAYISGEISEQTVHIAREAGILYYAAGHHATERYGVMALGAHLSSTFDIVHEFIDIENPV